MFYELLPSRRRLFFSPDIFYPKLPAKKNQFVDGWVYRLGAHRTRVPNFIVSLQETAWTFGFLFGKHVQFAHLLPNYLVSV